MEDPQPCELQSDPRIGAAVAEFLEAQEIGKSLDPETWLSSHSPEIWPALREFLDGIGLLIPPRLPRRSPNYLGDFNGQYSALALVGSGGMGTVYRATDNVLQREVAVKVLHPHLAADSLVAARFLEEARVVSKLQHPNIPPVYDYGADGPGGRPFFTMRLIERAANPNRVGARLSDALLAYFAKPTVDGRTNLLLQFVSVCSGVGYAHSQGVLHRDLKPDNVMLGAFGEVLVMDWGLSKVVAETNKPIPKAMSRFESSANGNELVAVKASGTPGYMAPEQARLGLVDARADVFALGGILTALLTGQPPFVGKSREEVINFAANADLDPAFQRLAACGEDRKLIDLARKCLSPNPDERPANGQAVADAVAAYIASFQEELQVAKTAQAVGEADAKSARKRRRQVTASFCVIIAVLVAGIAVSTLQTIRAQKAEAEQTNERIKAQNATIKAQDEERKALEREQHALRQQQISERTRKFLVDYFAGRSAWFGGGVVGGPTGPKTTLREVIVFAESSIGKEFADLPESELELRIAFASIRLALDDTELFQKHVRRARELAKQLNLGNLSGLKALEMQMAVTKAIRSGQFVPTVVELMASGNCPEGDKILSHMVAGALAVQNKDSAVAEREFRAALHVAEEAGDPTSTPSLLVRLMLGGILGLSNRTEEAVAEMDIVIDKGRTVPWGRLPIALARAQSLAFKVQKGPNEALALADEFEQVKGEFDNLGLWETEYGAMLLVAGGEIRKEQKQPAAAAQMLARAYQTAKKNPLIPAAQVAFEAGLAYALAKMPHEADTYLTAAMTEPTWSTMPEELRSVARTLRGSCRVHLNRYAEAEVDLLPELPLKLHGKIAERLSAATIGAGLGKPEYVRPFVEAVIELANHSDPQAKDAIYNLHRLAVIAQKGQHFELAIELHTWSIKLGQKHFDSNTGNDIVRERGQCFEALGRFEDAVRDFRTALSVYRTVLGDHKNLTRDIADDLARVTRKAGRSAEEIKLRKKTFEATLAALGYTNEATWEDAARLLLSCHAANDYSAIDTEAKTLLDATINFCTPSAQSWVTQQMTAVLIGKQNTEVAVELLIALTMSRIKTLGEEHRATLSAARSLTKLCRETVTLDKVVPVLELIARQIEMHGFEHPEADWLIAELAGVLEELERYPLAEPWRKKGLETCKRKLGPNSGAAASGQILLGFNLLRQKKWQEAEVVLRASLAWREKNQPDEWTTFNTRSMLGEALLGQKKTDDAAHLLREGYKGMKQREQSIPAQSRVRLRESLDRLIDLCELQSDAEELKWWKAERAQYREVAPMPHPTRRSF